MALQELKDLAQLQNRKIIWRRGPPTIIQCVGKHRVDVYFGREERNKIEQVVAGIGSPLGPVIESPNSDDKRIPFASKFVDKRCALMCEGGCVFSRNG